MLDETNFVVGMTLAGRGGVRHNGMKDVSARWVGVGQVNVDQSSTSAGSFQACQNGMD